MQITKSLFLFVIITVLFLFPGGAVQSVCAFQTVDTSVTSTDSLVQEATRQDTITGQVEPDTVAIPVKKPTTADTLPTNQAEADSVHAEPDSNETAIKGNGKKIQSEVSKIRQLISFRKIVWAVLVLVITYLLNVILVRVLDTLSERIPSYRLFIKRLIPILRIVIWIIVLYIILEGIFDPPLETVIAVAASLGIAVGFASQDILKNIFGGIMIIFDRPFQVGDKIEVDKHYGEVTQIGLRSSRIVTPDDSMVAIPNSEIMNKAVSNTNSGSLDCQVVAEIYLPVHIDINEVKKLASFAARSSKYVYLKKPVAVITVNEIVDKRVVIKFRVKAYVFDIRYEFAFKSDMTELIIQELNRRGIYALEAPKINTTS